MRYKPRKGIVAVEICGEYLLVPATQVRKYCKGTIHINETAYRIWNLLVKNYSEEDILNYFHNNYEIEDAEEAKQTIKVFIQKMTEQGYIEEA